jgi:predicted amidohydrolase
MSRIAIVQRPPAFLNKAETTGAAVASVHEAAGAGAQLVVFPEAFIPGYRRALFATRHLSVAREHRAAQTRRVQRFTRIGPLLNGQPVAPGDATQAARP